MRAAHRPSRGRGADDRDTLGVTPARRYARRAEVLAVQGGPAWARVPLEECIFYHSTWPLKPRQARPMTCHRISARQRPLFLDKKPGFNVFRLERLIDAEDKLSVSIAKSEQKAPRGGAEEKTREG